MAGEKLFQDIRLEGFNAENFIAQFHAFKAQEYPKTPPFQRPKVIRAFLSRSPWRDESENNTLISALNSLIQSSISKHIAERRKLKAEKAAIREEKNILKANRAALKLLGKRLEKSGPKAIAAAEKRVNEPRFL